MFADLAGSTALSQRLDPEEMRDVLRAYQDAVAGEVARFEGHLAKFIGDGVLAYFGWPSAHEDEAERSVRAGLAAVQAVGHLTTPAGEPLAARVGIGTGLVVVGGLSGEGSAREQTVAGETPNLVARLQALAEPGTVVIAERTRQLVGGLFELDDLGAQALKGFVEPVRAWRVRGIGGASRRCAGRHSARWSAASRSWPSCSTAGHWPGTARGKWCSYRASPASASRGSCGRCASGSPGGGDRQRAVDLLSPVYASFTEGFDTPDLREARAPLDALQ